MEKQFKIFEGNCIVKYTETEEKKQQLWDSFITWCKKHEYTSGESIQCDNFVIYAPDFMANVIDDIVQFETECE